MWCGVFFLHPLGVGVGGEKLKDILTVLYDVRKVLGKEMHQKMLSERKQCTLESELAKVGKVE